MVPTFQLGNVLDTEKLVCPKELQEILSFEIRQILIQIPVPVYSVILKLLN
jgi:hypothetical protein